jgi:hypothetical protein
LADKVTCEEDYVEELKAAILWMLHESGTEVQRDADGIWLSVAYNEYYHKTAEKDAGHAEIILEIQNDAREGRHRA